MSECRFGRIEPVLLHVNVDLKQPRVGRIRVGGQPVLKNFDRLPGAAFAEMFLKEREISVIVSRPIGDNFPQDLFGATLVASLDERSGQNILQRRRITSQFHRLLKSRDGLRELFAMQSQPPAQFGCESFLAALVGAIDEFLRGGLFFRIAGIGAGQNVIQQLAICRCERRLQSNGPFQTCPRERFAGLNLGGARDPELFRGLGRRVRADIKLLKCGQMQAILQRPADELLPQPIEIVRGIRAMNQGINDQQRRRPRFDCL